MASQQLKTLLAMPAALRSLLLAAPASRSCCAQLRQFHASCHAYANYRPMRQPISVGAFVIPHSPTLPVSDIPIEQLLESPTPGKTLPDELREIFTKNPATFYHGTSEFYTLKKNTRTPEICILGRSNVGKSTFVNALANRRDRELAHTSSKAGKTRAMNAYGFGRAPTMKELADTDKETKRTEDLPTHTFYVVDMPGYGHRSLKDWGKNISLYLHKRSAVKGAVLLIDGEVGPKKTDLMALELLCEAGVKTLIVLTKADKAKDVEMLRATCKDLWLRLREIESKDVESTWTWEKDFFVTAVGATKKEIGANTVDIARLAVARLAGLVEEKPRPEQVAAKGYGGKIISFDDLVFVPSKPAPASDGWGTDAASPSPTASHAPSGTGLEAMTELERSAREQHKSYRRSSQASPRPKSFSAWDSPRATGIQKRAYHTQTPHGLSEASQPQSESEGVDQNLEDFMANLKEKIDKQPINQAPYKTKATPTPFSKNPTKPRFEEVFSPFDQRAIKERRKRAAATYKQRHIDAIERRLKIERGRELRAQWRKERETAQEASWRETQEATRASRRNKVSNRTNMEDDASDPANSDTSDLADPEGDMGLGIYEQTRIPYADRPLAGKKARKAKEGDDDGKGKKKKKRRKGEEKRPLDPFDAKFGNADNM